MKFIYSIQSEWLKTRRSAASWLCLAGGLFIPFIYTLASFVRGIHINQMGPDMWRQWFNEQWQAMGGFLLPMGIILTVSLVLQIEYRNNTWKQVFAGPQSYALIFFSKFSVLLLRLLQFFLYFNLGIFISGILPSLILAGHLPTGAVPWTHFLKGNGWYLLTSLPVLAFQFFLSLNFRNFMIPLGSGIALFTATLIGFGWKYIGLSPFVGVAYSLIQLPFPDWLPAAALAHFAFFMALAFLWFTQWKER